MNSNQSLARAANSQADVQSPCVKICAIGLDRVCVGCGRTLDEIARWSAASDPERRQINQRARQRRAEKSEG